MNTAAACNTHRKTEGRVILITKIFFFVMMVASMAGLLFFSSIDHSVSLTYNEPNVIDAWTVTSPKGNVFRAGSSYRSDGTESGTFTVVSTLPETITDDSSFCMIIGADMSVYIDGELRWDFIVKRDVVVPGGCVKRFYIRVPLTPADAGKEIKFTRAAYGAGYIYQNTMVADNSAFFRFMISQYGSPFVLAMILMIFALVIVIVSLIMMFQYRRRIEMLYGALAVVVIAGWLITNSFLFPFIFGHYHVDGVLNYLCTLMMPFGLALYLNALQHGRYRKVMNGILITATINAVLWPFLHFTRLYSFSLSLPLITSVIGVELLIVAGTLVVDAVCGDAKEYRFTAIGFAGFFVCGLGEIAALNLMLVLYEDILMLVGLAFLLSLMVMQQADDLRRIREEGQKAVDLSEAKTRFLASMSHEIRTPINAILGMNEMILRENRDPVIGEYADSVKSSGQMLLMLVNDVLDFSKIEAGKMDISEAAFSLSLVLRDVMPMLRERAKEKSLSLELSLLSEVPDGLISDEFRIRQILINLTSNAIKYTDKGSVMLRFGGSYTGDDTYRLMMRVKDTGRGITEEDQKHLFEAFSRADLKKNRNIEGTGLGLAIVKSIIDSMHGEISVESTYGEGSEFIVELPVRVTDRTPLREDCESQARAASTGENETDYLAPDASVLAVDDNSANLKIVRLFLKRVGIVPELCDSGEKAIELCRSRQFDLILLDHMMPDPDGIRTLEIIREDDSSKNRETPAIVLTANVVAGSEKIYSEAGFVDYLTKPLNAVLLEQTIKKHLPAEKILPAAQPAAGTKTAAEEAGPVYVSSDVMVFEPAGEDSEVSFDTASFREKLEQIDGLDYRTALSFAGGYEELLKETVGIVSSECEEKIERMKGCLAAEDWKGYGLVAHSIKGLMASLGLKEMSERAKKHENAAKENDAAFIRSDAEPFLEAYHDICTRLREV